MIRLALKGRPPFRLSLDGLSPERLARLAEPEIAGHPLQQGNRRGMLGDWFTVQVVDGPEDRIVIAGGGDRLDDVGGGMTRGEFVVDGNAGARAGIGMSGGRLLILGSVGPGAGTAMRGGELRIDGDAGDQLGGALPGDRHGMSDGIVIVAGGAGSSVGDRMRRGLIVVAGAVGRFCGARMAAGTIVVVGRVGEFPGAAMRRGSILALGGASLLPSFADCGVHDLVVQHLLARVLMNHGLPAIAAQLRPLRRWVGDLALGGRGEILTAP